MLIKVGSRQLGSAMTMRRMASLLSSALFLLSLPVGCGPIKVMECGGDGRPVTQEVLYFGTQMPSGHVTQEEWTQFLAEVITSRFPEGLSSWQASGQWRSASGQIVREPSYVVSLIHPDDPTAHRAVEEITAVYKTRFQQEAVLRIRSSTCMSL